MIGCKFEDFLEWITIGEDTVVMYRGKKYWMVGGENKKEKTVTFYVFCITGNPIQIWFSEALNSTENVQKFLSAPIFEGKSFLDVQGEIEISDFDYPEMSTTEPQQDECSMDLNSELAAEREDLKRKELEQDHYQ